ncbi:hypothetical protein [Streptomyces sp. NPDC046805]|uniref:hypothetical protein n=1 Tax=Streptomyces sp. NPDC046805 TaxID=3155134 RepID=UPI0033D2F728
MANAYGTQRPSAADDDVLRTGACHPLTGSLTSFDIPEKAGVDAYFKSVNAYGGINRGQGCIVSLCRCPTTGSTP